MESNSSPTHSGFRQRIGRFIETLCFWGLAAASLASLLRLDEFRVGMLLTYPPRVLWMLVAAALLVNYLISKRFYRFGLVLVCVCLLVWDTPIGGGFTNSATDETTQITLLSFNVCDSVDHAHQLADLCSARDVDLLSLQEVSPQNREAFFEALPEYRFFYGDEDFDFEHIEPWVFTSVIGIKKSLLDDDQPVEVFTAITGHRTFAIKATLDNDQALRIVNVHTTKPLTVYYGVKELLFSAASKAARHRGERRKLAAWLDADTNTPTIIAGDFNAPANSYNLRLSTTCHSHRNAGSGLHLTFPRSLPIIGIDHIVATENIIFSSSDIVDAGFSDHCVQVATFFFGQPDSK